MSRTLWRFVDRTVLPSEHIEAKVMEFLRKGVLTKRQTINGQGQELVMTELNPDHPVVQEALPGFSGHAFSFADEEDGLVASGYDNGFAGIDDFDDEDNRGNLITPVEMRRGRFS